MQMKVSEQHSWVEWSEEPDVMAEAAAETPLTEVLAEREREEKRERERERKKNIALRAFLVAGNFMLLIATSVHSASVAVS